MSNPSEQFSASKLWFNPDLAQKQFRGAIFADRDGTLIEHIPYLGDPAKVALLPGIKKAVEKLLRQGIAFFVFTNQSGVERGYYPLSEVHACNQRMLNLLELEPQHLAGICIATGLPGSPDSYRKPSPLFIQQALAMTSLPQTSAFMIGDSMVDLETANNAGIHAWLVGNGKPEAVKAHQEGQINLSYTFAKDFPESIDLILDTFTSGQ
ncbi:MAG: HAD-IIIA family hydrolase [Opitutales bacterium]|nr:HAD-IIIA family hydrolase [Opitutales bacterium]MCH8475216.1 HAD-IIIA family hydrolase [Opitutales bacterium]